MSTSAGQLPARDTLAWARLYTSLGLSVLPIVAGAKNPDLHSWQRYQDRLPTPAELLRWFSGTPHDIAVICGAISKNLEVIDFDCAEAFECWRFALEESHPQALAGMPLVRTPGGGYHVYSLHSCKPQGNRKLARDKAGKTLVETRGEGGYVLAPGGASDRQYVLLNAGWLDGSR